MRRPPYLTALLLAAVAVLLPVRSLATGLAGAGSPLLGQVVAGVWCLKAMLLLHAGLLAWSRRWGQHPSAPLLEDHELRPARGSTRWETAVLGALLAAGLAIRLNHLGAGLWFDEIQTLVDYVRLPFGRVLTTYDSQNQHLLYSLFAAGAVRAFGESAWALRLPAALFGVASLWALYRFGRLVTGGVETLLAVGLLTFSYHHVWFSQNARGYTGLLLWTLLGSAVFLRLLRGGERGMGRLAALYGACMALAAYTHITAVLVVVAHLLVLAVLLPARRVAPRRAWAPLAGILLSASFSLLLYALVLPQVFGTVVHPPRAAAGTEWQSASWFAAEALRGLARGVPGGWLTLVVAGLVTGAGLLSYWRQSRAVTGVMLVPGFLSAAAIVALHHNLWPRFFFFSAGFAVLIAMRGGFRLGELLLPVPARRLIPAAAVLVIAASAATVPRAWHPKQDFAGAGRYIDRAAGPDDAVVTVDLTRYPYREYDRRPWTEVDSIAGLLAVEAGHRRTWVLYTFPIRLQAVAPELWQRLQTHYRKAAVFPGTVGGGAVVVMVSTPTLQQARAPE